MSGIFGMIAIIAIPLIANFGKAQSPKDYDFEIVEKSDDANLYPGQKVILWIKLKNTGNKTWYNDSSKGDAVFLNAQNAGNGSPFYTAGNWVSPLVVRRADQATTVPGGIASYGFYVTAPTTMATGEYMIKLLPVVDNFGAMIDRNLSWKVNIKPSDHPEIYAAEVTGPKEIVIGLDEFEDCNAGLQKKDGDLDNCIENRERKVSFKIKNTGNTTWFRDASLAEEPQINIATYNPKDRISSLYNRQWLSENRPEEVLQGPYPQAKPGEEVEFTFFINVPKTIPAGQESIRETFWLVAENKTWFENTGLMDVWIVKNAPVKPIPPIDLLPNEDDDNENIDIDEEESVDIDEDTEEDVNVDEDNSEEDIDVDENTEDDIDIDENNQEEEIDVNDDEEEVNINKSNK